MLTRKNNSDEINVNYITNHGLYLSGPNVPSIDQII
jgi:hypothetical protein